jgi:uncharacterized protein YdaL
MGGASIIMLQITRRLRPAIVAAAAIAWATAATAAPKEVLILHDSGGYWGYIGAEYAVMLENLLGHFDLNVKTKPVTTYKKDDIKKNDATFYIGSTFDEPTYATTSAQAAAYALFLKEVATSTKPVVWLNYNLRLLSDQWDPAWGAATFAERFGFEVGFLTNLQYNRVLYKNTELFKGVVPWANPGANLTGCVPDLEVGLYAHACSLEMQRVSITNAALAQAYASARSTLTASPYEPYVVKGSNLWFVGDIPFSYHSEEDRYLAFADLLHDMLGVLHAESHRALVRLEDVSAGIVPQELAEVTAWLVSQQVPFSVATVPFYRDPTGYENGGTPTVEPLSGSDVGLMLADLEKQGWAGIIQHGTTHQFDGLQNPYSQVTGDDFEFYRVTENTDHSLNFLGPVPGDSRKFAKDRTEDGEKEMKKAKLDPFAWEAPHYTASAIDYDEIQKRYKTHYGRLVFFSVPDQPNRFVGQFFPYFIEKDAYKFKLIPENVGYVEDSPIPGYRPLAPADVIRAAGKARVVRDGFASFYYHPYLGTPRLEETVNGIKAQGYTFVKACSLVNACKK